MYSYVMSENECKCSSAIWFILLKQLTLTLAILHLIKLLQKAFLKMLTLCTLALFHHARPVLPSSSCSMLSPSLLRGWLLIFLPPWGPGPPSPPSPELTPFLSGPRQHPTLMLGTIMIYTTGLILCLSCLLLCCSVVCIRWKVGCIRWKQKQRPHQIYPSLPNNIGCHSIQIKLIYAFHK